MAPAKGVLIPVWLIFTLLRVRRYGFARYETKQEAQDCICGLMSLKYEAGFARVYQPLIPLVSFGCLMIGFRFVLGIIQCPSQDISRPEFDKHLCIEPSQEYDREGEVYRYEEVTLHAVLMFFLGHARYLYWLYCCVEQSP